MANNYGIEETRLTREEFIEYANSIDNIDMGYAQTLLDILDLYHVRLEVTQEAVEWIEL